MTDQRPAYGAPHTDELQPLATIMAQAFCLPELRFIEWVNKLGPANLRVLRRDGELAAGLGIYAMGQFFGGRRVPAGGIGAVAVQPHLRAAGLGRELLRACLEELLERGLALSPLYPATRTLYRRLGWELAGTRFTYAARPADLGRADPACGLRLRPVRADDGEGLRALYGRVARCTAGHLDRHEAIWDRVHRVPEGQQLLGYLVEDERLEGYLLFTQEREGPTTAGHVLTVKDLVFATPRAGRRLLALLASHRSVAREVRFWRGPGGPLQLLTDEQALRPTERTDWMLRVVDVKGALEARGWPVGLQATVTLAVEDDALELNNRAFTLAFADGGCRVSEAEAAELQLDVRGLAALYMGWSSPAELRQAGYLRGPEADDAALGAAFAGPAPWLPDFF